MMLYFHFLGLWSKKCIPIRLSEKEVGIIANTLKTILQPWYSPEGVLILERSYRNHPMRSLEFPPTKIQVICSDLESLRTGMLRAMKIL